MTTPAKPRDALSLEGSKKLKIWVPEPVFEALTRTAEDRDISRPELARRLLFTHVFGRPALDAVIAAASGKFVPASDDIMFSRRQPLFSRADREPEEPVLPLGKSTVDALVLVSDETHEGLRRLAERYKQPLGTYAAYVLCWAMFGRAVYSLLALKVSKGMWIGETGDQHHDREAAL